MNVSLASTTLTDPTDTEIAEALLSRERAILDFYQRVIEQCKFAIPVEKLHDLKYEHQMSVAALLRIIQRLGATPGTKSAGLKEVKGIPLSAKSESGRRQSISLLARAEKCLLKAYSNILKTPGIRDELLNMIDETLLPRVESSIETLVDLIDEDRPDSHHVPLASHRFAHVSV